MKTHKTIILLFLISNACNNYSSNEIHHKNRNRIVHVEDKIVDIHIDSLDFFGRSWLYIINDYLIIVDHQAHDRGIHLIDKNSFKYLTSTGDKGKGPGEIVRYGHFASDKKNMLFYGIDFAKLELFKFELDSIFKISYKPKRVLKLRTDLFPASFGFINDSTIIGSALDIINHNTYKNTVVKMNTLNGDIQKIGNPHPDINPVKLTTFFSLCEKNKIYVEGYARHDLLSISNLDGEVQHYIYGPKWQRAETKNRYYSIIGIMGNKIIASYDGETNYAYNQSKRPQSAFPTKFIIFDLDGNYLSTLETGHEINFFCLDEENNRIIVYFEDRMHPLAYLDLNTILD